MEALGASKRRYFDTNPDYSDIIHVRIANQNLTAAEDWVARIRIGDFALDVQQMEARSYA